MSLSIVMTGSGGSGVMTMGNLLLEAAAGAGWYGLMKRSAGPQIRGGEAASMLRLSDRPLHAADDYFDLVLSIDPGSMARFTAEIQLTKNSYVVTDMQAGRRGVELPENSAKVLDLPMKKLAKTVPGGRPNMVALGALARMIGLDMETIHRVVNRRLHDKGEAAVDASRKCVQLGFDNASELPVLAHGSPKNEGVSNRWLITGNEAAGLGAIRGGVRFVAAYPITPATEMLEWLAASLPKVGGVLVQAEDELASVNQIIGASFGGTPALTATSGPGFALMTEALGLSVCAEVPIVVVDVMRCGPSTGIATKSEQSDLNIALHGLHGDAPHIVVAPASVEDCAFTLQWAVQLGEALQTAVVVLSDQSIAQSTAIIDVPEEQAPAMQRLVPGEFETDYRRYAVTDSAISPMAIPGQEGGQYTADGLEHDEQGIPSSLPADHYAQLDKRDRKIRDFDYGTHWAELEGEGETAVITWGSSTGPVREALHRLRENGTQIRLIALRLLSPERPDDMRGALEGVKRVLIVEQSHGGQFHRYLRAAYDLPGEVRGFCRPGPLTFRPGEIIEQLADWGTGS